MQRCPACDHELSGADEPCPECGALAPAVAGRIDTGVRDRFSAAVTASVRVDGDVEYAFGGKRSPLRRARRRGPGRARRFSRPMSPVVPTEMADEGNDAGLKTVDDLLRTVRETWAVTERSPVEAEADEARSVDAGTGAEPPATVVDAAPGAETGAPADHDGQLEPHEPWRLRLSGLLRRSRIDSLDSAADDAVTTDSAFPVVVTDATSEPVVVRRDIGTEIADRPDVDGQRQRRGDRTRVVAALALVAIAIAVTVGVVTRERPASDRVSPPRVVSTDEMSFVVPGSWTIESTNTGVVALSDPGADTHLAASVIKRKSLKKGLSLASRAAQVRTEFLRSLDNGQMSKPVRTNVGGYDAIRTEITATSVGRRVAYIQTVVKTAKSFVNVLVWAPAERMGAERDELMEIVGSLRVATR